MRAHPEIAVHRLVAILRNRSNLYSPSFLLIISWERSFVVFYADTPAPGTIVNRQLSPT
jgi:hypothetical protein